MWARSGLSGDPSCQLEHESPFRFGQLGSPVSPDRAHIQSHFAQLANYQDLEVLGGHRGEFAHEDNPTPLTRNDHLVMVKADRRHTIGLYREPRSGSAHSRWPASTFGT